LTSGAEDVRLPLSCPSRSRPGPAPVYNVADVAELPPLALVQLGPSAAECAEAVGIGQATTSLPRRRLALLGRALERRIRLLCIGPARPDDGFGHRPGRRRWPRPQQERLHDARRPSTPRPALHGQTLLNQNVLRRVGLRASTALVFQLLSLLPGQNLCHSANAISAPAPPSFGNAGLATCTTHLLPSAVSAPSAPPLLVL
jgi:hypothetical protein